MLDLSAIPVVDNHCHPLLLDQAMDKLLFRRYFTESSDPILPQQHIENTVYYLWMLRQMASFYGCSNTEDAILAARNKLGGTSLVERFLRAANFDTLVLDTGFPPPDECISPEQMGQAGHCRAVKLLRLETLMQRLVVDYSDFDELVRSLQYGAERSTSTRLLRAEEHRGLSWRTEGCGTKQRRGCRCI